MAVNRTSPTQDWTRPNPRGGSSKQADLGQERDQTFAGDQDDREYRGTPEQQDEVPRSGAPQGQPERHSRSGQG